MTTTFNPNDFTAHQTINNPFSPLVPETTFVYRSPTDATLRHADASGGVAPTGEASTGAGNAEASNPDTVSKERRWWGLLTNPFINRWFRIERAHQRPALE